MMETLVSCRDYGLGIAQHVIFGIRRFRVQRLRCLVTG